MDIFIAILQGLAILLSIIGFLAGLGFFIEKRKRNSRNAAPGKFIDVSGRKLHYLSLGEGAPAVLWEAGGGISSIATRRIQKEIATFTSICVYDRAGYGWSDPVDKPRTFDDLAADFHQLQQQAEVQTPYILVGESMGGLMVRYFASNHPHNIAAIVLLDSAEESHTYARLDMLHKMQNGVRSTAFLAKFGVVRLLLHLFPSKFGIPENISEEHKKALIDDVARSENFSASSNELDAYFSAPESMRSAGGFGSLGDIPLIVVTHGKALTGSQAFLEEGWTEAQQRLLALSTESELVVAENSGHAISVDAKDQVVEIIRKLVESKRL